MYRLHLNRNGTITHETYYDRNTANRRKAELESQGWSCWIEES